MKSTLLTLTTLVLISSCGRVSETEKVSTSKDAVKLGLNKRTLVSEKEFSTSEARYIGILLRPNDHHCTASLIAKNLIITAGHCVTGIQKDDEFTYLKGSYLFKIKNGDQILESEATEEYYWGAANSEREKDFGKDWAILRLKEDLGTKVGWFGIRWPNTENWIDLGKVKLAGFSLDFLAPGAWKNEMTSTTCKFNTTYRSVVSHGCDTGAGDSGSPIYKCDAPSKCYLYAIHYGFRDNMPPIATNSTLVNVATRIDSEKLKATIKRLLRL